MPPWGTGTRVTGLRRRSQTSPRAPRQHGHPVGHGRGQHGIPTAVPRPHLCHHGEVDEAADDAAERGGELAAQRAGPRLGEQVQDARDETLHTDKLRHTAGLSGGVRPRPRPRAHPHCRTWLSSPSTRSMKKKSVAHSGDKGISVTALG